MKRFDFSQPDGFPLTQLRLDWIQGGFIAAHNAIAGLPAASAPVSISGVMLTAGDWTTGGTVSDGWINHPEHGLMPFIGGDFTPTNRNIEVYDLTFPLLFKDLSVKNVQISRVCRIAAGTGSQLQALSTLRWEIAFGQNARTAWVSVTASPSSNGGRTITLQYKKNTLTNMLHLRGTISYASAQLIPATVQFIDSGIVIPVGFRPSAYVLFPCFIRQMMVSVPGPDGQIREIQGQLAADGQLGFAGIKPNVGTDAYTAEFNLSIPLD